MSNSKRIFITILLCILIFSQNISEARSITLNNSYSKTSEISKFIPDNNELLFYSNYKNNEIKRFIRTKFTNNKIKKIDLIKEGLVSFLGFDLKDNLNNIYGGEFILSTFKKPNKKREVLIIFKTEKEVDLNSILNIDNNDYKLNQLFEIKRPNTLNLITHIFQTNDNFIICASNKELIYDSLKALNSNENIQTRESKFKYYKSKVKNKKLFLYTSKQFYDYLNIIPFNLNKNDLITEFNFDNDRLTLNSSLFSNSENPLDQNHLNLSQQNDIIVLSNNITLHDNLLNNSTKDTIYKELIKDISKIIKDKIYLQINKKNWLIGLKTSRNNFSINQLDALNDFHQDKFKNDNYIYTIFSKNNLEFIDQKTIYKPDLPIFVYESDKFTLLSNDLTELLNTLNNKIIDNILQAESKNLIIDDELLIRNFNNQIYEDFLNIFDSLNYFTANGLSLKVDTFESKALQKIPENIPSIQLKTNIKLS